MASAQPARSRSPSGRPRKPVSRPPRDRRDNSNSDLVLRLGNFNVLNLVNPGITFYGKNHYTPQQVDRKIQWIANQLRHMKAGICGFEEVFSTEPLQKAIELSGFYGPQARLISYGANGSGPTVALVSNYPVLESVSIPDFPPEAMLTTEAGALPIKKFSRPVLKCVIKLNSGDIITVFVAHLKSKRPIVPDELRHSATAKAVGHALSLIHRAAESAALRCLVVDDIRKNNRPVVVLGDLNDTVHSVTTEIVSGTQPWKKLPFDQKQEIWETLLWSTNEVQVRASDRDVTYSHIHNGRYEVLDHVLVSQDFVRTYPDHFGEVQYLQLFNDHLVDATLSDDFGDPCESDHGQIVAHIKIFPREDAPRSPAAAPAHAAGASPALAAAHAAPAVVPVVGAAAPAPAPASPAPHTAHPSHPSATALAAAHAAAPAAPAATPAVPVVAVTTPAPAPAKP